MLTSSQPQWSGQGKTQLMKSQEVYERHRERSGGGGDKRKVGGGGGEGRERERERDRQTDRQTDRILNTSDHALLPRLTSRGADGSKKLPTTARYRQ